MEKKMKRQKKKVTHLFHVFPTHMKSPLLPPKKDVEKKKGKEKKAAMDLLGSMDLVLDKNIKGGGHNFIQKNV